MTYEEARREVEQGVLTGRYTRTQARRLRAAIRVFERYDASLPFWRHLEEITGGADWAERLLEVDSVTQRLSRARF